jgi:formylglycine-generating enzyme required for sulfatase activity
MIMIPTGIVALRDDRTQRRWDVELQSYKIGAAPVTQALYAAVTGSSLPSQVDAGCPVESVSWLDAVAFCNQLSRKLGLSAAYVIDDDAQGAALVADADGYRLPNEAEREYACRAGTRGPRYGHLDDIAWFAENSGGRPQPVGGKQPNAWGLYDMLGNVWEWCCDQYDPQVYGAYRIFRGGGWADRERGCLATNRRRSHPTFRIDDLGFRLCANARVPGTAVRKDSNESNLPVGRFPESGDSARGLESNAQGTT